MVPYYGWHPDVESFARVARREAATITKTYRLTHRAAFVGRRITELLGEGPSLL